MQDPATPWLLDPSVIFLNHGSFGACPRPVLAAQERWRQRLEREPVRFMATELEVVMDAARAQVAGFLGSRPEDLAFVGNTTTGVNTVLRSLPFVPGDELLITNHEYNACANAARFIAEATGATVRTVEIPFPLAGPDEISQRILAAAGPRTRLALLDHITSQTALILPLEDLVSDLNELGIDTLVDGAHAPGMLALNLDHLGAAYYTGNLHKWVCAPKGAAFLHVRRDRQESIRPLVISHGANSPRTDRSRFRIEFDWMGTFDPTPFLAVPAALRFMESLHPDGWAGIMAVNHHLALAARKLLCAALRIPLPAPDSMVGCLASIPLPDGRAEPAPSPLYQDPLQVRILEESGIQVPIMPWPAPPRRLLRVSAQVYNTLEDYEQLSQIVVRLLDEEQAA